MGKLNYNRSCFDRFAEYEQITGNTKNIREGKFMPTKPMSTDASSVTARQLEMLHDLDKQGWVAGCNCPFGKLSQKIANGVIERAINLRATGRRTKSRGWRKS